MERCPEDLPDAKDGSKAAVQDNQKVHQQMYHDCAARHNQGVTELEARGIKGK